MRPLALALLCSVAVAPLLRAQNCFDRVLGTDLRLGDDASSASLPLGFAFPLAGAAYTQISVCSNGYLCFGPGPFTGGDYTPTVVELATGPPRLAPLWTDLDPSAVGGGHVWFRTDPGRALVSWAGVFVYGTTEPVDLQVELLANGHIDITYGAMPVMAGSRALLMGASPGGGTPVASVTFAHRPFLTGSDSFAEFQAPPAFDPPRGVRLDWSPAAPGFAISDVTCQPNDLPPPAQIQFVGHGCPRRTISIYQVFENPTGQPAAVDLTGVTLAGIPNGRGGYFVTREPCVLTDPQAPVELAAGDDTTHRVRLPVPWPHASGLVDEVIVSSNGFLSLGTIDPGPGCCNGSVAELLAGPPRIAGFWLDLDASRGGKVFTNFDPQTHEFSVSWIEVPEYGAASSNTFQIALLPDGTFAIRLFAVDLAGPSHRALVGYSEGRDATDPGPSDLSAVTGFDLGAAIVPLQLWSVPGSLPRIGSSLAMRVTEIAPTPNGHMVVLLLGQEIPAVDLTSFGAPGCVGRVGVPAPTAFAAITLGVPTTTFAVPIPSSIVLAGQVVMAQAISDDLLANPLGCRVSEGARLRLGL